MSNVPGNLIVSEDVIASVAGHAASTVYGVVGMASPAAESGIAKILPKRRSAGGVKVTVGDDGTTIDLYVILEHGVNINTVSDNLAEAMSFALKEFVQGKLTTEVHVQGIEVR